MPSRRIAQEGASVRVERRRLMSILASSGPATVIVASGPAGSGKSTLAGQWVEGDPRASATVRLPPNMDDPVVLADRLIGALEELGSPAPQTRTALAALSRGSQPRYFPV